MVDRTNADARNVKVGSKDQSTARQRRLQRLQLVAVVVPTVAILVASILMGRSVANAGDGRRELQNANRSLVESRHTIQEMQADYWARRVLDILERAARDHTGGTVPGATASTTGRPYDP